MKKEETGSAFAPATGYAPAAVHRLSNARDGHGDACVCDRCKRGCETFLLASDVDEIIEDCAKAVETQVRGTSYQWLNDSMFARLVSESAQRVRSLKSHNAKLSDGGKVQ